MRGEGAFQKYSRDEGGSASLECLPSQDPRRGSHSHEPQHPCGGLTEAWWHCFQGDVQSSTGDHGLDRTALCDLVRKINSQEEQHSSRSVESGPFHGVVSPSVGI